MTNIDQRLLLINEAQELQLAVLRAILDTLIHQTWTCGCGHTNGAELAICAQCKRKPGEGAR